MLVVMNQMTLMVADLIKPLFSHYRLIYLTFLLIFFFFFNFFEGIENIPLL